MAEQSRGQKAAETRAYNTKTEVEFLAKTFFEFTQFSFGSGLTDISTIVRNFDSMIDNYVQLGKIKQESYNKFKAFLSNSNINIKSMTKEEFVRTVTSDFGKSIVNTNEDMLKSLANDFNTLLVKYNIVAPIEVKNALFIQFGLSLAAIYKDPEIKRYFENLANRCGLGNVKFEGPKVVTVESDGCSCSKTIYGSLWSNLNKIRT